jgi:hypothetical protein
MWYRRTVLRSNNARNSRDSDERSRWKTARRWPAQGSRGSRANEQVRQEAAATGELPLTYMLRIMREPSQPAGRRDEMAKAAAPFCHSRLSSVEHSGEIARPTVIRAPAVSATPDEWQAEYAPGAKEAH